SCDGAVGGSFGGDVALPSVAGGVTPADCKTGSAAAGGGSRGDDVTVPAASRRVIAADCETGSRPAASRGSDPTVPAARILGKATDGPVAATTPSAGRGAFTCSSKPAIAVSRSSRARRLPSSLCCASSQAPKIKAAIRPTVISGTLPALLTARKIAPTVA